MSVSLKVGTLGSKSDLHPAIQGLGDSNLDRRFDQLDIIAALRGAKYRQDVFASWEDGDWNGNGRFDQLDIIEALRTGNYLRRPYVA